MDPLFGELHSGLAHEAPGSRDDTLRPDAAWEAYYAPLAARVEALLPQHGADHPVRAEHLEEIAVRRAHAADYGYGFFVAAP